MTITLKFLSYSQNYFKLARTSLLPSLPIEVELSPGNLLSGLAIKRNFNYENKLRIQWFGYVVKSTICIIKISIRIIETLTNRGSTVPNVQSIQPCYNNPSIHMLLCTCMKKKPKSSISSSSKYQLSYSILHHPLSVFFGFVKKM